MQKSSTYACVVEDSLIANRFLFAIHHTGVLNFILSNEIFTKKISFSLLLIDIKCEKWLKTKCDLLRIIYYGDKLLNTVVEIHSILLDYCTFLPLSPLFFQVTKLNLR